MTKHKEKCNCSICNSNVKEERQYAAVQIEENFYLMDVEEYAHMYDFMENRKSADDRPDYPKIEPEDETLTLVYGVLIPNYEERKEIVKKNWEEELSKYKEYAFVALDEKNYFLQLMRIINYMKIKFVMM